jgi:hypothetical protein
MFGHRPRQRGSCRFGQRKRRRSSRPEAIVECKFVNVKLVRVPISQLFRAILDNAPDEHVSVVWLVHRLHERSFGMIMLLLGLLAVVPGISIFSALLLLVIGFQMMMAQEAPILPRIISDRTFPVQRISRLVDRAIPVIRTLERIIRPRWHTPFVVTKRIVGVIVLMLAATLFLPVPFSNIIPGILTMLIAISYLEEDGVLLSIALCTVVPSLAITWVEGWAALQGANFLFRV